ncbi:MAG: hypothetical protein WCB75_22375 [Pseudolabrys sp.]
MIGQDNHGFDRERMILLRLAKRAPQFVDVLRQQPQTPFCQIDGEEEAATSDQVATIIGQADILAWRGLMGIASLHPSYGLRSSRRA